MKLLLVRHPKPDVPKGQCYGQADVPIVADWQQDAEAIRIWLRQQFPQHSWQFYHSPLQRTRLLAHALHPDSIPVDALKEVDFGTWERRLWSDIPKVDIDAWLDNLVDHAPYQGETLAQLLSRVMAWFEEVKQADQDAVLVTHSGVIKVMLAALCGMPLAQCFRFNPSYSSITELDIGADYAMLNRLGAGDWVE
ncbi:Phosphoserine phosphatase 1 [Marinomonas aquimarina]|uniref:Phosphoserine phosphatase 1 n=1 Tax=Marinomonas aquimarina TaxID=295068 RepID=A0A1A8T3F0_9GAMM|nr:histidine phosphatase family protein [Marinomonas aquimarina]SBS26682.1 Phosphoserine phosphatase 1 [Marinomonas aquimarina]